MAAAIGVLAAAVAGAAGGLTSGRWRIGGDGLVAQVVDELSSADPTLLRSPALLGFGVALRCGGFALDIATLWACLAAVGIHATAGAAGSALMLGTVARTLGLVPSGLGTSEAAVVWGFGQFGVALEPALAAAILYRGVSFWLPLVPGLWFSRRALRDHRVGG